MIFRRFVASSATLLGTCQLACSTGESGLVLGRPLPAVVGGQASGGTGGTAPVDEAGSGPEGGAPATPADGGEAGSSIGAGGGGNDDDWIRERCTPTVKYTRDSTSGLFDSLVPEPWDLVWTASHAACRELFHEGSEVKDLAELTILVEDYDGVASAGATGIRLSTRWLQQQSDDGFDVAAEIAGLVHFTTSLVYQSDGGGTGPYWVVAGIADLVRLHAGYVDPAYEVRRSSYTYSSKTAAFFFDHLLEQYPELIYQLNQRLGPGMGAWSDDAFITYTGTDVDTLWAEYQATLP